MRTNEFDKVFEVDFRKNHVLDRVLEDLTFFYKSKPRKFFRYKNNFVFFYKFGATSLCMRSLNKTFFSHFNQDCLAKNIFLWKMLMQSLSHKFTPEKNWVWVFSMGLIPRHKIRIWWVSYPDPYSWNPILMDSIPKPMPMKPRFDGFHIKIHIQKTQIWWVSYP